MDKNKILQCLQFSVCVYRSIVKCRRDNEHLRDRSNIMFDQMDHTCELQMQQTSIVLLFSLVNHIFKISVFQKKILKYSDFDLKLFKFIF